MCFSATASFGASAVLGVIGVAAVAKAKTKPQRLFASIPLVFAVQQLSEGFLWLSQNIPARQAGEPCLLIPFLFCHGRLAFLDFVNGATAGNK